jgi:hypothetical protein
MPQKDFHFYFSIIILFLASFYSFQKYSFAICINYLLLFFYVGRWYNKSELEFCMEVNILHCLHFSSFMTKNYMFSAIYLVDRLYILLAHYQNIVKHMFYISKEFKKYGFLRHNMPINKLTIFYNDLIMSYSIYLIFLFLYYLQTNDNKKSIPAFYINILVVMSF